MPALRVIVNQTGEFMLPLPERTGVYYLLMALGY
jgi:hypothetical protein